MPILRRSCQCLGAYWGHCIILGMEDQSINVTIAQIVQPLFWADRSHVFIIDSIGQNLDELVFRPR